MSVIKKSGVAASGLLAAVAFAPMAMAGQPGPHHHAQPCHSCQPAPMPAPCHSCGPVMMPAPAPMMAPAPMPAPAPAPMMAPMPAPAPMMAPMPMAVPSSTPIGDLPNARPGECYARVKIPAQYEMVPETVVTREGHQRTRVTEPRLNSRSEQVEVRPAHVTYKVIPPQYTPRQETVMVRPGYERLTVSPPQYKTVTETVQVSPPRLEWRPGSSRNAIKHHKDAHTGAVYCLVEVPGETRTITRTILAQPEMVKPVAVPPEYRTLTMYDVIPARVEEVPIPPKYASVIMHDLAEPAQRITEAVPPQTQTIEKKVLVSPERYEWVSVLCETNSDANTIREIQSALKARGFYPGAIDGIMGPQTQGALESYQRSMGMPVTGYLTMDTVNSLLGGGVSSGATMSGGHSSSMSLTHHHSSHGHGHSMSHSEVYPMPAPAPMAAPAPTPAPAWQPAQPNRLEWGSKTR